jgi:tetratricopeptide (TPR) repeat protein
MRAWLAAALLLVAAATHARAQGLTDDPAFALYRQAVQAAEAKDYARASQLAREAIAAYPDHLLAWYLLGQSAMGRSAWEEAADAFGNVVKRYPASFAGHRDLGLALQHLGKTDEARAAFERALALRPDSPDVRLRLAFMLYEKGQREAALPHLESLAGANSTAPEVWLLLARTYYERNDLAGSEKAFTRAVSLRDDGKTWFNLGVVRLRLNNPNGAREAFKRAAEHNEVREQAMRELDKLDPTKLGK